MNPLISVIVPVYNVENYLDRCIESIVNQTYKNLEIILIDDGSTDCSGMKCDDWGRKDHRIIIIHTSNGGQARARNKGLRIAKGSLIGFVDSDDYIDLKMFESMQKILNENDCDIVECDMKRFQEQDNTCCVSGTGSLIVMSQAESILDLIQEHHLQCTVPNMLLKAEIASKVQFDEGKTHEDVLWPYRACMMSRRIAYVDQTYYFYFQRPDSTMNKAYSEKRFDGLDALEKRAALVKEDYPAYYSRATRAYLGACMYQYQFLCRQPQSGEYDSYKHSLYRRFCDGDQKALYKGLSVKYKIWYSLFKLCPNCVCKIRNILKIGI